MLRICFSDSADGQHWTLCGRLAGPWVDELRSCWRETRERSPLARVVVDLRDVIFIDEAGEGLLGEMETAGAELLAAGVENRHVIATLKRGASRPRRRLEDLCSPGDKRDTSSGGDQ